MPAVWKCSPRSRTNVMHSRVGFTLVELMVVIVIIVLLIGLVLPAITGVRTRAREAQVANDISQLEKAITAFKVDFGIEPPSQITLYADAGVWDVRSKGIIKQIWPSFDFSTCGGAVPAMAMNFAPLGSGIPPIHLHLSGSSPASVNLNGAECLVFFLGGMVDTNSGAFVGFSKDPAHPFAAASQNSSGNAPFVITNRQGPYFEFSGALRTPASATAGDSNWTSRLTDRDNDWLPEYRDPLPQQTMPYVYFNGASGSYRTLTGMPPAGPANPSPVPSWYNTDGFPFMNYAYYSNFDMASPRASAPYKPKGYQIISPGSDGSYGTGGRFNPDDTSTLSKDDRDNLTNFHSGRLAN